MRRWFWAGMVLALLSLGVAGSATAANPGPIGVPAVQASVRDQCTGKSLTAPFSASLVDATGTSLMPSKVTTSAFRYDTFSSPNPNLVLHITAPGYVPLGGAADPGVPLGVNPGPINKPGSSVQINPGPTQFPGGVRLFSGLKLAILLAPTTGCATALRAAMVTAVTGKVVDADTGTALSGLAVQVLPDPATPGASNPGPIQTGTGTFKVKTLACGAYKLAVSAPGHDAFEADPFDDSWQLTNIPKNGCNSTIASGDLVIGNNITIALPRTGHDAPPVIDAMTTTRYGTQVGVAVTVAAYAHDPDPGDTVSYTWTVSDSGCTFATPANQQTDLTCTTPTNATIKVTATDTHNATDASSFVLAVLPAPAIG